MKSLRRAGQIIATVAIGFFLFMAIGELVAELRGEIPSVPWTWESTGMVIFLSLALVFTTWAWKNYKIARWMLLVLGMAFMIFACVSAGFNQFFAAMVSGFPYVLAGLFMLDYKN